MHPNEVLVVVDVMAPWKSSAMKSKGVVAALTGSKLLVYCLFCDLNLKFGDLNMKTCQ